jgi:hypothetical protein
MAHIEQHIPTLRNIAVELRNRFPRESLSELTSTDPQAWPKESFDIAAKIAYQNGALRGNPKGQRTDCREVRDAAVLPAGYARVARKIADRRRMLARYHLASLLAFLVRTSGTRPYKRFKMAVSYMTGCVEIYTDVNYYSEHGQSQENQWTGKFVLHIFAFSFIWLPIGKPEFPAPRRRCRGSGVERRSNPRENYFT